MTISEKAAYIRGLAEGLELDPSQKEVKVLNAMLDLLGDMAVSVTEMEDDLQRLSTAANAAAAVTATMRTTKTKTRILSRAKSATTR